MYKFPAPESSIWNLRVWNLSNFLASQFYSGKRPWHDFQSSVLDHIISGSSHKKAALQSNLDPYTRPVVVLLLPLPPPPRGRGAYYHSIFGTGWPFYDDAYMHTYIYRKCVWNNLKLFLYPGFPKFIGTHNTCRCWSTMCIIDIAMMYSGPAICFPEVYPQQTLNFMANEPTPP